MSTILTPFEAGVMIGKFEQLVDDFPDVFPVKTLGISFDQKFLADFISLNCSTVNFNFAIGADQRLTLVIEKVDASKIVTGAASPNGGGGDNGGLANGGHPYP